MHFKFTIVMEGGNNAFFDEDCDVFANDKRCRHEIAQILIGAGDQLKATWIGLSGVEKQKLRDSNGNTVGEMALEIDLSGSKETNR